MKPVLIFIVLILLIITACNNNSPTKSKSDIIDLSVTPMENEEAELAAMWLSGELVAPVDLYERIIDELQVIRGMWDDSVPEVLIEYKPHLLPSRLNINFSQDKFDSVLSGKYNEWDDLNTCYRLDSILIDTNNLEVEIQFKGRLNPVVLLDAYSILTDVDVDFVKGRGIHVLLIYNADGNLKYYFYKRSMIPLHHPETIDYFDFENGSAVYRGRSNSMFGPAWGDTVLMARENFIYPDTLPFEY